MDVEKEIIQDPDHVEDVKFSDSAEPSFTAQEEAAVIRKLDFRLLPLVFVLYSLSVLDRSNLGNARLAGLEDDIDLSDFRYNWLGTSFYIACMGENLFHSSVHSFLSFPSRIVLELCSRNAIDPKTDLPSQTSSFSGHLLAGNSSHPTCFAPSSSSSGASLRQSRLLSRTIQAWLSAAFFSGSRRLRTGLVCRSTCRISIHVKR